MAFNEEARIPVYLNDEQAKAALKTLTGEAEKWRKKMHEAMVGGDLKGMKDAERELKKVTSEANKLKRETFDVNKVLSNLNTASINDLKKTMSALRKEQAGLNRDSKEYQDIQKKISNVKGEFDKINGKVKEQGGLMGNLIQSVKGLLPAFGFGAIAVGAKQAFDQVIASTDTLSTKWAVFMGGMKGATDEFFRTLATGDFSNFIFNMQEAIRVGREYEQMLDDLEAKQRALSIAEADVKDEIVKLEEDLRNKGLTDEQRIAAGKRRIQIEEELAVKRTKLAQEAFNNETMLVEQQSRMRREELMQLISDFDSEKKARAEKYNQLQRELKLLEVSQNRKGAATGVLYPGMTSVSSNQNPRIGELKTELAGFSSDVVEYAGALSLLGNVTDEQLNKMVAAYTGLKDAEVSGRESIKRVITMVNSLQAPGKKGGGKTAASATAFVAPEQATDDAGAFDWVMKQAEAEAQALAEKKASEEEWTAFLKKQIDERMAAEAQAFDIEKEIADARVQLKEIQINAIGELASTLAGMFEQGSAAQIAMIAVEKAIAIAQIWMNLAKEKSAINLAAANISTIPGIGPALAATYSAAMTAKAISAAKINTGLVVAQAVSAAVSSGQRKKKDEYYSGGFTGYGADTQVAGVVHKNEFVINSRSMRNPQIARAVSMIDTAQRTGTTANVGNIAAAAGGIDTATANRLIKALEGFEKKKLVVYTELVKKDLDTLAEIEQKRGM